MVLVEVQQKFMKIAMMVRGFIPAPRPEDIVYVIIDLAVRLAQELTKRGHQVDFYAPEGSHNGIPFKTLGLRPLIRNNRDLTKLSKSADLLTYYMPALWDQYLATEMFSKAQAGKYDILHFHHPESSLPLAHLAPKVPVVYTIHDPLDKWHPEIFKMFQSPNISCIAISDHQRASAPQLPHASTVYNGIDTDVFKFSAEHDDYLLFLGRIVPEKGVREAVRIAKATGEKLLIVGPLLQENRPYFTKYIKPHLNGQIQYLGHKPHKEVVKYFQRAKAMLMPIRWEEPFGMTMIEAMSCGTPVIAFRRGSVPEVVIDQKTGFIVDNMTQMAAAVKNISSISRHACRQHIVANFSIKKMVDNYEATFEAIIERTQAKPKAIRNRSKEALAKTLKVGKPGKVFRLHSIKQTPWKHRLP